MPSQSFTRLCRSGTRSTCASSTTYTFSTLDMTPPYITHYAPSLGGLYDPSVGMVLTFDKAVRLCTESGFCDAGGTITLEDVAGVATMEQLTVFQISDTVLTVTVPTLAEATEYKVRSALLNRPQLFWQ